MTILSKLLDYQKDKSKREFQEDMIKFAGGQLDKNRDFIAMKALFADILSAILVVEFVSWIPWVYHTLN